MMYDFRSNRIRLVPRPAKDLGAPRNPIQPFSVHVAVGLQMIETARPENATEIARLIQDSFDAFVAPDYSPEGVEFFQSITNADECSRRLCEGNPAWIKRGEDGGADGYIEIRDGHHVTRFFVAPDRIGIGIGKALHAIAEAHCRTVGEGKMTVYSSPFAVGVYERLGYVRTGEDLVINGMRTIPMEKNLEVQRGSRGEGARRLDFQESVLPL